MSFPRRLLIDTDGGIDDAKSILIALADPGVEIVAITTARGNTENEQVGKNVLRLLKVAGRMDVRCYALSIHF